MDTITGRISKAAIDRMPQLFDGDPTTVLQELFQNARRAGATQIVVTQKDRNTVTIADDGCGITNPQSLLDFGQSDWEDLNHEHPAGMGFFALSRYHVQIFSQPADQGEHWRAELEPEHFTGKKTAKIVRTANREDDTSSGTVIRITHEPHQHFDPAPAALYFPLLVRQNGEIFPREAFLGDAVARRTFEGVEIGVFRSTQRRGGNLDFHGVITEGPVVTVVTDPDAAGNGTVWSIAYSANVDADLELVAPTRHAIVRNKFSRELTKAAERFLYSSIQALEPSSLLSYGDYENAVISGVEFPGPQPKFTEWRPTTETNTRLGDRTSAEPREIAADALILQPKQLQPGDSVPLYHALKANGVTNIFGANPFWEGYPWYDAIPKITSVHILVRTNAITTDLTKLRELLTKQRPNPMLTKDSRPDAITFELTCTRTGRARRSKSPPTPPGTVGLWPNELPTILTKKASEMSIADSRRRRLLQAVLRTAGSILERSRWPLWRRPTQPTPRSRIRAQRTSADHGIAGDQPRRCRSRLSRR